MALDYSKWDNLDDSDDEDSRQQYNRDQPSTAQPSPPALSGRLAELSNDPGVTWLAENADATCHALFALKSCS